MSKEFRPRLNVQQLEYLVSVLKWYEADLEEKVKEIEVVEREIFLLWRKLQRTGPLMYEVRELEKKRERLKQLQSGRYYDHRLVVKGFVRRFEGLLNGEKLRPRAERLLSGLTEL